MGRLFKLYTLFIFTALAADVSVGGQISTRVTPSGNWNSASTWIQTRAGTASFTSGSTSVTGTGTSFTTELAMGDTILLQATPATVRGRVASITNNTALTLAANAGASL